MIESEDALDAVRQLRIVDSARTRRYSAQLDTALNRDLHDFDWKTFPFADPPEQSLRKATAITGLMAFCFANPWSTFHRDGRLLRHVKARLRAFATTDQEGIFCFRDQIGPPGGSNQRHDARESHGNSWYLEPLIYAALWVGQELTAGEKEIFDEAVRRAANMHAAVPLNEMNNRGVIRQAILALAGRYLGDSQLIRQAIHDFHREPIRVFNRRDGQINEGTGPDANYSGTTFVYLYIYRLFSGDASIDDRMVDALRWFTWISDPHGIVTLFGASTRKPFCDDTKVGDYLPGFERYAARQPHFGWLLENGYLAGKELGEAHHCVSPLIWAMMEHGKHPVRCDEGWFNRDRIKNYRPVAGPEFMYTNEGYTTLYFVLRENYHATTTLMGRSPYKGLQHWSYRDEPPVIWPTISHASRTRSWGLDTSHLNVSGTKLRDKHWIEGEASVLIMRFENVWHHYLLTPTTLLLLISSDRFPREDIWVIDKARCGQPILSGKSLSYEGRQGRLHFAQPGQIRELENAWHLRFEAIARTHIYAFSNESFVLLEFDPAGDRVRFADDTGKYELQYEIRFFAEDEMRSIGYGANITTTQVRTVALRQTGVSR